MAVRKGGRPRTAALAEGQASRSVVSDGTGQPRVVFPLTVMRAMGLEPGDELEWCVCAGGAATVTKVNLALLTKPDRWKDAQATVNLVSAAEDLCSALERDTTQVQPGLLIDRLRAALKAME